MSTLLRAENIRKTLGGREILKGISLGMCRGDLKVLIGPSGGGKSTLLQCLNCLIQPDSGSLWLEEQPVNLNRGKDLQHLRQQVGMIFQDFNLFDHLTAQENVSVALRKVKGMSKRDASLRAMMESPDS